jgi:apolipoprotein N-acyltransferase
MSAGADLSRIRTFNFSEQVFTFDEEDRARLEMAMEMFRPDLLINVTNDSWFGGGEPRQHEALARYRSVEVGVPMVCAVNTGPSSILDRDGDTVARLAIREDGGRPETLLAEVELRPRALSFYAGHGGTLVKIIAWAALAWWLVPALVGRLRKRPKSQPAPATRSARKARRR